jgi:hypothetical protein
MMVSAPKDTSPPRVSTTAYNIRSKALDLLERSKPKHEIVFSYGTEHKKCVWDPLEPISYQHCPEIPDFERRSYRRNMPRVTQQDTSQWVDALLPAMSCISSACRVGISEIAKHTSDGFQMVKNEVKDRKAVPFPQTMRGAFDVVKVPAYQKTQKIHKDVPYHVNAQHVAAAGQPTSEVQASDGNHAQDSREVGDLYRLDPADWEPLGFLFVPAEDARKFRYSDDDMNEMTEDGNWSEHLCPRLCPIE